MGERKRNETKQTEKPHNLENLLEEQERVGKIGKKGAGISLPTSHHHPLPPFFIYLCPLVVVLPTYTGRCVT